MLLILIQVGLMSRGKKRRCSFVIIRPHRLVGFGIPRKAILDQFKISC